MDDVAKMLGYFLAMAVIIFAGVQLLETMCNVIFALTATPLGMLTLLIFGLVILKAIRRR